MDLAKYGQYVFTIKLPELLGMYLYLHMHNIIILLIITSNAAMDTNYKKYNDIVNEQDLYLVNDLLVQTQRDVCLKRDGHALEERTKAHSLVPLPDVLIVTTEGEEQCQRTKH